MKSNLFKLVLLFASVAAVSACGPKAPKGGYIIKGSVEGIPDNAVVQLIPVAHEVMDPLAEATVTDGKFTFTGIVEQPTAVSLIVKDAYGYRNLMVENTKMEISGSVSSSAGADGTASYGLESLKVAGSPMSDKYDKLMQVRREMDSIFNANQSKHAEITAAIGEAKGKGDTRKVEELMNSKAGKAMLADEHKFFSTLDSLYNKTFMDNKDSFWGPLMMISLTTYLSEDMRPVYEAFSQEAKDSYYGKMVRAELYPAGMIGEKVPDFTVKDASGKEYSLAQLTEGKKYILIDFWASWCAPCRREIPNLRNLYAKYGSRGFQIISISRDKNAEDWKKAIEDEQLTWPNFLDESDIAKLYKVRAIPTMYLVDADGRIVAENVRGEALAEKVAELFK